LDEEARIVLPTSMGSAGFRQVLPHPDGEHLLAIGDSPEAVYIIDLTELEDDATSDRIYDIQSDWLALPVGGEDDAGERTRTSMGPGRMVLDDVHNRLFVSNFNANSVTVFDLSVAGGIQVAEIQSLGENPYSMVLTPDATQLVVANYTGDLLNDVSHSTLSIFDVNPESDAQYALQTQVVNQ
jgi:DNA-binding beta-propeller fold protein YncE